MKKFSIFIWFIAVVILTLQSCREDLRDIKLEVDNSTGLDLNFTFVNKPDPGMELIANLYYVEEENELFYERDPDRVLKHTLNEQDIESGLTLTFEEPIHSVFAYVISYVDVDANGELSDNDIAICYSSQSVREVIKGIATAENVSHREFLTMTMDRIYSSIRPPLEVNFSFPSPPLPGSNLELRLYYVEHEDEFVMDRAPNIFRKHTLTEDDIANGLTLLFEDIEEFPYLYALAYVDINDDAALSYGDIAMFYEGVSVNDVEQGRELPVNISVRNSIDMEMSEWYVDENYFLMDIDGNTYRTVIIGGLEWMAENLRVTRYRNGALIPTALSNTEWVNTTAGAYSIYPYNQTNGVVTSEEEMIAKYGLLYNGYAVMDPQGLAPIGWRVATDDDYKALERIAGMSEEDIQKTGSRGTIAAKLRIQTWSGGTDDFGFAAVSGGFRQGMDEGSFRLFGAWDGNSLWTSTQGGSSNYMYRRSIRLNPVDKALANTRSGMSVRCVRDKTNK